MSYGLSHMVSLIEDSAGQKKNKYVIAQQTGDKALLGMPYQLENEKRSTNWHSSSLIYRGKQVHS